VSQEHVDNEVLEMSQKGQVQTDFVAQIKLVVWFLVPSRADVPTLITFDVVSAPQKAV
jgi:hypothetical protein